MNSNVHAGSHFSRAYRRPAGFAAAADAIPLLVDDTYHLFHLACPPNTTHHPPRLRSSWVRQRSKDLVNWTRDAAPIIPPGESNSLDPDRDGAWTGSAVTGPDGNMHIFYTGYSLAKQVILHAKSSDRHGSKFEKPLAPITLDPSSNLSNFDATDFRDPYVFFNDQERRYWMVVATRLAEGPYWTRGCIALLKSDDLETWTVKDEPLYAPNNILCPECPELFTLGNGKWYLVYSRFSAPDAGTLYVVADSPYGPFRSPRDDTGGRFDGRRWYAAKSCPKSGDPTKRIAFAWVPDWNEADGKWLWGGSLAPPREITATRDGSLVISPISEFLSLLQRTVLPAGRESPTEKRFGKHGTTTVEFLPVTSPTDGAYHSISLRICEPDAKTFGLLLNFDHDMRGYRLSFAHVASDVYSVALVTDLPPLDDFWAQLTKHEVPKLVDGPELVRHGAVKLDDPVRLLMSDDVIEFFVGGKVITYRLPVRKNVATTGRITPDSGIEDSGINPVGLFVEDGEVHFQDLSFTYAESV